jgi:hypothetical protein
MHSTPDFAAVGLQSAGTGTFLFIDKLNFGYLCLKINNETELI